MKILTIIAQFPPDHAGGYELRVKDVMDRLASAGNRVSVLTTKPSQKTLTRYESSKYSIKRILFNRYKAKWFPRELLQDLLDTKTLEREIVEFKPDLIYLGHTYPLTKQLLPFLASLQIPIFYDEGGNGLKGAWTDHGRWFEFARDYRSRFRLLNIVKPAVVRLVLWMSAGRIKNKWSFPDRMNIFFNSELNRSNAKFFGVPVENTQVIHSGVDTEKFTFIPKQNLSNPIKILIPGRIETKKGQLDGIALIHELSNRGIEAELLLVGPSSLDGYADLVKNEINKLDLVEKVHFVPMVDQDQIVELYHQADICFFSSHHQSGFSRVPLEAMACGCVVISYGNEGSNEVIRHGENGFLVTQGEVSAVTDIVTELVNDDGLVKKNVINARACIEGNYSLEIYISQIEQYIKSRMCE